MKLKTIPIAEISEGSRRREDYGELSELVNSIKTNGLIQPIAVGLTKNYENSLQDSFSDSFKPYLLLAGGRRFRACVIAGIDSIPVRIYERHLTELELRSIELEENVQRKELTWKETLALEKEIHELQVKIHGPKVSTTPGASGHSMRDTARILNKSHASVSLDLKLSKAMENHPSLPWDKCKNKHEANKLLKKISTLAGTKISTSETKKLTKSSNQLIKKLIDSYLVRNCFEAMAEFPNGTFNFAEVDPPFEGSPNDYVGFLNQLCGELYRVLAKDSWLVFWATQELWFEPAYEALTNAGFKTHRVCGVWVKPNSQTNNPERLLGNNYEIFFYAAKGNPKLFKPGRGNTFNFAPVSPQHKIHPAERPVELMRELLKTFTKPNSRVLVPFAGSGNTLIAAALEDMIPVGYDLVGDFKDSYTINVNKTFGEI